MADSRQIGLESGKALMARGPHALHEHIAAKFEAAMGRAMPQTDVRFRNLSVKAEVVVSHVTSESPELPTLWNTSRKAVLRLNPKGHRAEKIILNNVSGVFKPGTITLLLGQPGSGKSSLMKVLSGRFPEDKNVTIEGDITYDGKPQAELKKRVPQFTSYIAQRDKHYATLTVKETLEFAHEFCGGQLSKRGEAKLTKGDAEANREAVETARALFKHYPEVIIRQLGLEICQDTIVGNSMIRGISGGERKRVTTGEMEFGMKYISFMDEISTGLDSAATFDIIKNQRATAKTFHKTIVIALLQPAPEVFALFDDVMILNEGEVMYHGPRDQVLSYFESLGFVCPEDRDAADFLLDLGTNQQHQYQGVLPAKLGRFPRDPNEYAELFRSSAIHRAMLEAVDSPLDPDLMRSKNEDLDPMPNFRRSFWENTRVLMKRQTMVTLRNTPFIRGRTIMVLVMGLIFSSAFWQVDPTNVQNMLGVLFQGMMFLGLGQVSQIPTFMEARDIYYKQRAAGFFPTSAYVVACSVAQIPLALAESLVFGTMVYWMCGFAAEASAYFCYMILLVLTNLVFASWFFLVTAASPDFYFAKPFSTFTMIFYNLFAGFIMTKSTMPGWVGWIYWINPIAWCFRALAVNQYRSTEYDVCEYENVNYCSKYGKTMGEYYLGQFDLPSSKEWLWAGMLFMLFAYALFMLLGNFVLEYHRYESPSYTILKHKHDEEVEELASGYKLAKTPKSVDASPSSESIVVEVQPREKNFVPVTLAFQDLWYSVPKPGSPKESLELLKGISGYAMPGTMTALMGSSGAGKTTLMDVIAGRKTGGTIQGQILLNGYEATDLAIRRATGYCEQMDVHSEASTFREAFTFSSFLRQDSSLSDAKKYETVNEVLDLLDMHDIADQMIRGSSVEQMKRLTIGVELAAQPSVLFLDEPTSGLDARSAKVIMDGVRKVANSGRTVVCTIHQPSSDVFFLFDSLLLLKRGGETVFFGDLGQDSVNLIKYFEAIPNVAPLPDDYNPATWMLEVIGAGVGNVAADDMDFVKYFEESEEKRCMDELLSQEGVGHPSPTLPPMEFSKKRAASSWTQMRFLVQRFVLMYWRTPSYNLTRLVIGVMLALMFGITYLQVDYTTYQGINSGMGMVYMTVMFNGIISFNGVLPVASGERGPYYRERASQTYNALWYFVGSTIAEIPYVFSMCLFFTIIFYPMVGFSGFGSGVLYWINMSLHVLLHSYMGELFIYALPSVEVSAIIGVLVTNIFFTFMGFNPTASIIPEGYKWLYTVTPMRYTLSILSSLAFGNCATEPTWNEELNQYLNVGDEVGCQPVSGLPVTIDHMTVQQYVESVFNMRRDDMWADFGYVLASIAIFRVLALLALRYLNFQKR